MSEFASLLVAWQKRHGRHDLPWQNTRDPYRVWLSEIMLQQTQVATVIPYYERFLARFPTLTALAAADDDTVMAHWAGLGYYARARNLHRCAREVVTRHGGDFPRSPDAIAELPGIGRSTAAAIATFAFGARAPILDGNVKRVLTRCFGIDGFPGERAVEQRLWRLAEELLPAAGTEAYIQGQMDLGATLCTRSRPRCDDCPLAGICVARCEGRQDELPTPKPSRPLPEREATVLILVRDNRVLLEKRPPAGIWGGLLTLPELPPGREAAEYCRERFGTEIGHVEDRPSLTHVFTHFRLRLTPRDCIIGRTSPMAGESQCRWVALADVDEAPLPAPIRQLLRRTAAGDADSSPDRKQP